MSLAGVLLFGPRAVGGLFQHIGEQSSKKVAAQALTVLFKLVHDLFIDKKYTPARLQKPVDTSGCLARGGRPTRSGS